MSENKFKFPTEVVELPSKGLPYPESSPLAKGEITIKLMTAKEEDILTSPNLVKKGIHLDKLLESVVVEPGVNVHDLLIGDKNAILISSRVLAFGPEYEVTINDPNENEPVKVVVDLLKIQIKEIDESLLSRQNEYDKCVICGKESPYTMSTHIDLREGYVEGGGQGCFQPNTCNK